MFSLFTLITNQLCVSCASQYWVNQTVQVPAGGSMYWSGTFYQGDQLQGAFNVISGGDMKFYILDAANYAKCSNGQTFVSYYENQAIQIPNVDFTVPYDGTWFLLLDNSYSIWTNKAVTVTLTLNSNHTNDNSGIPSETWLIPGLIAVTCFGVIVYVSNKSQKKQK